MGYPSPEAVSDPVRDVCRKQLRRVHTLIEPWGGIRTVGIENRSHEIFRLESGRLLRGRVLRSVLRHALTVEICLVTVGARMSAEVQRLLTENATLDALVLDAAASAATSSLMDELRRRICAEADERGEGTTLAYGPGFRGWQSEDTKTLFSYLQEGAPVRLNDQLMMTPEKSLLNVIGTVPLACAGHGNPNPCRLCDLERCSLRQSNAAAARKEMADDARRARPEVSGSGV